MKAYVVELKVNPDRPGPFKGSERQDAVFEDRDEADAGYNSIVSYVAKHFPSSFVVPKVVLPDDAIDGADIRDADGWLGTVMSIEIDHSTETKH
jgi:hypothetical protein